MQSQTLNRNAESCAHALAMVVASNGRVDERELRVLDELDAFGRLDVMRCRFVDLARVCLREVGTGLCKRAWLRVDELAYHDGLLDAVVSADRRLLVCRLAAAVITADGRVTHCERLVYERTLRRWRISQAMVTHAILTDRVRSTSRRARYDVPRETASSPLSC